MLTASHEMAKSAVMQNGLLKQPPVEIDRNKEANNIIIKHNRRDEKDFGQMVTANYIPGSKLDPSFLNLFAK